MPLQLLIFSCESGHASGVAARVAEQRKHSGNDGTCKELGCNMEVHSPSGGDVMREDSYFSIMASRQAVRTNPQSQVLWPPYLVA